MEQPGNEVGNPERVRLLEVIRQRIRSGYYDSLHAMDRLARALVDTVGRR